MASDQRRAIFLDRDGVLVRPEFRDGRSFAPTSLADFFIYPDAPAALAELKGLGFDLIVVTNQPDVGAGRVAEDVVVEMHARLRRDLPIDDIKVCYHTREMNCACRKPKPGLLLEAAAQRAIDLGSSIMVGDRASDIEAGRAAGCRTAFIDLGYTAEDPARAPDFVGASLQEIAGLIALHGVSQ